MAQTGMGGPGGSVGAVTGNNNQIVAGQGGKGGCGGNGGAGGGAGDVTGDNNKVWTGTGGDAGGCDGRGGNGGAANMPFWFRQNLPRQ